jgi:hypothetical protein
VIPINPELSIGKPHLISKFQVFKGTPISYIMVDNRDIMGYLSMSLFFPWWDSWCQGAQSAPGGPCIATACLAEPGGSGSHGEVEDFLWENLDLLVILMSFLEFRYCWVG